MNITRTEYTKCAPEFHRIHSRSKNSVEKACGSKHSLKSPILTFLEMLLNDAFFESLFEYFLSGFFFSLRIWLGLREQTPFKEFALPLAFYFPCGFPSQAARKVNLRTGVTRRRHIFANMQRSRAAPTEAHILRKRGFTRPEKNSDVLLRSIFSNARCDLP